MLDLPKSTEFNKRIPKQKFYEHAQISPTVKKNFTDQVQNIYWKNKISETTINLTKGNSVSEIEVFEIQLRTGTLDENVLRTIDRAIPYHIIFILSHEEHFQVWAAYKDKASVKIYFHTDWLGKENLPLTLQGLTLDEVYENFIRQIGGGTLQENRGEALKSVVERKEQIKKLEGQIKTLQKKVYAEKQFNRQIELSSKLKILKRRLEQLRNGEDEI